ncbi:MULTISPECIES: hypothetical protein [unclassified Kitasatospora]|uniref:hypothetical protein n=1 Tax=unclassified Kitasatospora TaxID=2633591 RepID=UPI002477289D|nr:hypothetical protein [Kitasatospora sp. MAP12-44]
MTSEATTAGRNLLPRCLGLVLAVAACAPGGPAGWTVGHAVLALVVAPFGWWAGPPVTGRPVRRSARLLPRIARHRNTLLAVGAVLLAALNAPSAWLAGAFTALLLGYLLYVDARTHGRRPTGPLPALAAYGAATAVLLAAVLPTGTSSWARLPAVLGVGLATLALGSALWSHRPEDD